MDAVTPRFGDLLRMSVVAKRVQTSITQTPIDLSAPLPTRRSLRQHVPSERARSNADVDDDDDDDANTITVGDRSQNGKQKRAVPKAPDLETEKNKTPFT
jgi:hypothetical protein